MPLFDRDSNLQKFLEVRNLGDRLGQTASYVTDVARAWQLAEKEEAFANDPSLALGLQCRYALVSASLNSLAANIPAELMVALVEKKVWTAAQGLAYARQLPDEQQQAQALRALAPHLPQQLLPQALEAARAIQDEYDRVEALSNLAPLLKTSAYLCMSQHISAVTKTPRCKC